MQRCLFLAELGAGRVAPNPMVGAVLVHEGRIIGEGYHQQYGEAHAEMNCINSVTDTDKGFIAGSTMYVSLEPCSHYGKTPPCTDLLINNKIQNVIIGCRDSFALVAGKGIEKLQQAGLEVTAGVLVNECIALNKRFFTFHEKQRPFIILKWAQSNNGKVAAPPSKHSLPAGAEDPEQTGSERLFISNELTNRLVHKWRAAESAILVGSNTALLDDPSLTTRLWPGKDPLRLVIDRELKLPLYLKLFNGNTKTILFNYRKHADIGNPVYYQLNENENLVAQIIKALYSLQIQSLIVEGGSKLLQYFIDEKLWDEVRIITNTTMVLREGLDAPVLKNSKVFEEQKIKDDVIIFYKKDSEK